MFLRPGIKIYGKLDGVCMKKKNNEDVCVRGSDDSVLVTECSGMMEIQAQFMSPLGCCREWGACAPRLELVFSRR